MALLQALEHHAISQPEFNPYERPCRPWQDSANAESRAKYTMNAKIFAKRPPLGDNTNEPEQQILYKVHPWISRSLVDNNTFIPNPDRPRYFENTEIGLTALEASSTPYFQRGDIILMSFRVGFLTGAVWNSEIIPMELIRVGKLGELLNDAVVWSKDSSFVPLMAGGTLLPPDGAPLRCLRSLLY